MLAHCRPVPIGILTDPALDTAGHPAGLQRVACLGETLGVRLPQRTVRRQQAFAQHARPPRALRTLVAHPDRHPRLRRGRPHPTGPPQLTQPPGGVVGATVAGLHGGLEQLEFGYAVAGSKA